VGNLTRDEVVDNTTLTGVTNTGISSGRLYWESDLGLFDIEAATAGAAVLKRPAMSCSARSGHSWVREPLEDDQWD
jgi:hypothetical protein